MRRRRRALPQAARRGKKRPPPVAVPVPGATARLVRNECWARIAETDDRGVIEATYRLLRFRPEGFQFMPRYKSGHWDGYISLYRRRDRVFPGGLVQRVADRLKEHGVEVVLEDRSEHPLTEAALEGGTSTTKLRDYQVEAVEAAIAARAGVLESATGTGKTEVLGAVIQRLACRTLIIVASRDLAWQTIDRFQRTLSFPNAPQDGLYGLVGDDVARPGLITAALYQTLHRRLTPVCGHCGHPGEIGEACCKRCGCHGPPDYTGMREAEEWLASFDCVVCDESHRAPAHSWWPIVNSCPAYWRFGLSATPFKSDIVTELKLVGATGEVFYRFPAKEAVEAGWLTEPVVTVVRTNFPALDDEDLSYMTVYREGIVEHEHRNRLIADIAAKTSNDLGLPTLILVQWIEHGKAIRRALRQIDVKAEFVSGRASTEERRAVLDALASGRIKCVISTVIFDEGIDVPEIGAMILAGGGKARHRVIQRIGRGLRVVPGKDYLPVFDLRDSHSPKYLLPHSRQRRRAVKDAGFAWQELTQEEVMARLAAGDMRPDSAERETGDG